MAHQQEQVPEVLAEQIALDRAQRREERQALVQISTADLATAPQRTSFALQSMGEAMQFATVMSRSNFVAPHLRGKEGDCLAIVLLAMRWGMDPFAVANKTYFTKEGAPPAFESQLVNAVVNSSGALLGRLRVEFSGQGESLRCTVTGRLRADPRAYHQVTQHIARIRTRHSPLWKDHPEQQLEYYTTRAWARAKCPEVLLGVYTPEELAEIPEAERTALPSELPPRPTRRDYSDDSRLADDGSTGISAEEMELEESAIRGTDPAKPAPAAEQQLRSTEPPLQEGLSDRQPMPETAEAWDQWADCVRTALSAAPDVDAVNALRRQQQRFIDACAAPLVEDVESAFFDAIAALTGPKKGTD